LRNVVDDPDPELRQRVLGILMREKDGFAQKKLLEGLKNPDKALVSPAKALQLLSYDVHGEAYKVARSIVDKPPNDEARREALRLLAADANAAPLFEKLLRDKNEQREIRQISASALHALKPETLQKRAKEILLDKSDYDDIKATSLTALAQFGDKSIGNDKALIKSVNRMKGDASAKVKQGARQFLSRYGR
jgi:selenocysteine-specific translation elongation factor